MTIIQRKCKFVSIALFAILLSINLLSQSPVEQHGRLQTLGNRIVDKNDSIVSFAGMSLFWSNWAGDFYRSEVINWLETDWNCTIVRAAMGIEGDASGPGYLVAPETEKLKIKAVVEACIDTGIYVIIDWHDHNAQLHTDEASGFFAEMAREYGNYDNVIYEIFNEPLDVNWQQVIKPYARIVIDSIRKYDSDNLIVVGTRNWSQMVSEAAASPINDTNVAYSLHFYVGTHYQWLRDEAQKALDAGIPLFVTEWGLWGENSELDTWIQFMKKNKLSACNWSVNDKVEPSSALNTGASRTGGWSDADLTWIGKTVRNYTIYWDSTYTPAIPDLPCDTFTIPARLEAESYCDMSGIQAETCLEGGENVGYIEAGDWFEFTVNSNIDDTVAVEYRISSLSTGGEIELQMITDKESKSLQTIEFSSTGGWQNWTTVVKNAYVPKGIYTLRLIAKKTGFNINWLNIMSSASGTNETLTFDDIIIYPNPADQTLFINTKIQNYNVEVFDIGGRRVLNIINLAGKCNIEIGSFSSGTYILKIDNERYSWTQLFIKK